MRRHFEVWIIGDAIDSAGIASKSKRSDLCRLLERLLLVTGLTLIGIYVIARASAAILSYSALEDFRLMQHPSSQATSLPAADFRKLSDFSLWSSARMDAYHEILARKFGSPVGVLRIPRLTLDVPVFEGVDVATLNRGAGWIPGTAHLGEMGNIGIAGHRDGFFRGLKSVATGDILEVSTPETLMTYKIDAIEIVKPTAVYVLNDKEFPSITLVTCFPFYYVGAAPERYIVRGSLVANPR